MRNGNAASASSSGRSAPSGGIRGKGDDAAEIEIGAISREALRNEFEKNSKEYYSTRLFEDEGFVRGKCKICGKSFWSAGKRDTCGDSSHTPYGFFKEKPANISYVDFWKRFADFFKKNGHDIIKRYPVVSRWRQDLYFTIAGIQDFQRIENGVMNFEYSSNPLLVPQICLRFNDIDNVGITGRHFTSFMMANQTAFNWPKEGYWRDRTIELNFKFLTEVLGIKKEDILYHEDVWAMPDFSEFGPSLESFVKGLELVNSVFTQFEYRAGKVKELESRVVDVGWGFERELWFYTGHDNAYEAVFRNVLKKIEDESGIEIDTQLYKKFAAYVGELDVDEMSNVKERLSRIISKAGISEAQYEKHIKPAEAIYALLDHTRTLLFAVTDGSLPSNIGGGYNLRVLLRRSFDFVEKYKIRPGLDVIAELIAKDLKELYPELLNGIGTFRKVTEVERERYGKTKDNAKRIVEVLLSKKKEIGRDDMRRLYESNGITPELIESVASAANVKISLPENKYSGLVTSDVVKKGAEKKQDIDLPRLRATKQLYYDFATKADAEVQYSNGKYLVLNETPFYPEGGGQATDMGNIGDATVVDVQKVGDIIVHVLEKPKKFRVGSGVTAEVNVGRRNRVIAHHTATHLISAAARSVLGNHAWQEGAKKEPDKAHIDIAHYERLGKAELDAIENLANSWLRNGIRVKAEVMERGEAENRYGFSIYQGHGAPAKMLRIVTISSLTGELIDAEACGGLHAVGIEHTIGMVKITNSYRIHDGVDRIEFVAGEAALERFRKDHDVIDTAAEMLNTDSAGVTMKLEDLRNEKKNMLKDMEKSMEVLAESMADAYKDAAVLEKTLDMDREALKRIANSIAGRNKKGVALLMNNERYVVCTAGVDSGKNALEFMRSHVKKVKGGGDSRFAEGKIMQ